MNECADRGGRPLTFEDRMLGRLGDLTPEQEADVVKFHAFCEIDCQTLITAVGQQHLQTLMYTAVGQQLDTVGKWVGVSRNLQVATGLTTLDDAAFRTLICAHEARVAALAPAPKIPRTEPQDRPLTRAILDEWTRRI